MARFIDFSGTVVLFYAVSSIFDVVTGADYNSVKDQCSTLCRAQKLPLLEPSNFEKFVCQSGCRFFNIIKITGGLDVWPAVKHCHITCNESYSFPNERKVCTIGCKLVASDSDIKNIIYQTDDERMHEMFGESEILEEELLTDPSLKRQLSLGFNDGYRIPETHVRTMPIEKKVHIPRIAEKEAADWLECASKNSGIPRSVLLAIMLGTIMVAIWLTLSLEARKKNCCCSAEELDEGVVLEIPADAMENFIIEKDPNTIEKDPSSLETSKFILPPKYCEINEINDNDDSPPEYCEIIATLSEEV